MAISANDKHVLEEINRCCGRIFRILPPSMSYSVLGQHEDTQDAVRFNLQRIVSLVNVELSSDGQQAISSVQLDHLMSLQAATTPFAPLAIQYLWQVVQDDLPELRATLFRILSEASA